MKLDATRLFAAVGLVCQIGSMAALAGDGLYAPTALSSSYESPSSWVTPAVLSGNAPFQYEQTPTWYRPVAATRKVARLPLYCEEFRSGLRMQTSAIMLHRSRTGNFALARDAAGNVLLNARSLDLNWGSGPNLDVYWDRGDDWSLHFNWFTIKDWGARTSVLDAAGLLNSDAVPIPGATFSAISSDYGSDLDNFEFNVTRIFGNHFMWLAGFRYMAVDERLSTSLTGSGLTPSINAALSTENRLYGFQTGGELRLFGNDCDLFQLTVLGKVGIFGNDAQQNAVYDIGFNASTDKDKVAFVGSVGINARLRFTDTLSLVGGYQVLWIDGVTLAPNQLSLVNDGYQGINTNSAWYHGATVGLEARF